ncbi:Aldehyde/histidinol dehydrogenase [Pisolithus orientalis]|uniref:Aldehyde/histidinol dehydrogenase n=1 Tax=Pisolithus orientalis TaxID=936130 RepID=UPI002224B155|nr:Aldehyde/histidinol dehydrogenase [Pisolithus orientalis]KAI6008718.1 Aldehyde/histidinol dehydrogenase [Pisolithus orientalis]
MANPKSQTTISPHSQAPLCTRVYPDESELDEKLQKAARAQKEWQKIDIKDRIAIGHKFMEEFEKMKGDDLYLELTEQMGRPVSQVPGEIRGFLSRAQYMLSIAEPSLADVSLKDTDVPGFRRYIKRVPLGVVFVIAPWNFPYLTSINAVLPAVVAGNAVILKPSPQTPMAAERFATALVNAGVPEGIIQVLHLSPTLTSYVIQHELVDFVCFTGSVGVALELGGKDPAYGDLFQLQPLFPLLFRLFTGAMFNSGQSCCAIERIYVHESVYDKFVEGYVDLVKKYKLGDPTKPDTNLGPVFTSEIVKAGAKALVPEELFPIAQPNNAYVAPQVLVGVDHTMDVMMEETFGPVVGIQKVSSDEEAVRLMNDSPYGLTASIWTNAAENPESEKAFLHVVDQLNTGTVFLNRCDFLDPALSWTGVKNSGRGVSLSKFGYDQLTRPKSVHMKIQTK